MGWWRMDENSGGISCIPVGEGGEANISALHGGDGPADAMDHALKEICEQFQKTWSRQPFAEEIQGVFTFCTKGVFKSQPLETHVCEVCSPDEEKP